MSESEKSTTSQVPDRQSGLFKRLFSKLDQVIKDKADAKAKDNSCCSGSDGKCC